MSHEPWMPYERPPLSKAFLASEQTPADLALRGEAFYRRHELEVLTGTQVAWVDHTARTATLRSDRSPDDTSAHDTLAYETIALATGSAPRALNIPGADLAGVHHLATLDDALALRALLPGVRRAVVIGAGFIGLEIAATLAGLGCAVRVLEVGQRVLARAVPPTISSFFSALHASHGVEISTGAGCVEIVGRDGRAVSVRTTDGEEIPADLVLVGIGSVPRTALAEQVGAELAGPGGGVLVDPLMRTSVPGMLAAGDCAAVVNPFGGAAPVRLESVQNATDQGRVAGATAAGALPLPATPGTGPLPPATVPWFWSDQYDVKLQIAGLHDPRTREVLRGDPRTAPFSTVHLDDDDRIVSACSVSSAVDHMAARRLVGERAVLDPRLVADTGRPLKTAVAQPVPQH